MSHVHRKFESKKNVFIKPFEKKKFSQINKNFIIRKKLF